jgi:hypothetical protein
MSAATIIRDTSTSTNTGREVRAMTLGQAIAAALDEFHGQLLDVSLLAAGGMEVGFTAYLEGARALGPETMALEFTDAQGQPVGDVVLTERALYGAEWREVRTPGPTLPLLALSLDAGELRLHHAMGDWRRLARYAAPVPGGRP